MKEKIERMNVYFDERIADCERRGRELLTDERADEANFEKVRANVFDIFRTVLAVAVRVGGEDEAAVFRFFQEKTEKIPENWEKSREKAETHHDPVKQRLEQIKLETIQEIRWQFSEIREAAR